MSSSEPPQPPRRSMGNPLMPGVAAPPEVGDSSTTPSPEVPPQPLSTTTPDKVGTVITSDPQIGTQPQSKVGPAPKFTTLGRYKILGELGQGGMGVVYLAEDTVLKRKVALKIPQFEPRKEEQMRARFTQEAQLAAQLDHPNICRIFDVGEIEGQLVMAMEYIEGRDLSAYIKPDKLMSERAAAGLVRKIALAMEVAHRKGLVHRDLKPANIMLSQPDKSKKSVEPKIMDFGLARSLGSADQRLTQSGMIVGTPCYMSKEQWSGKDSQLGPTSDVFSLGVILYELLTGHLPYDSEDGDTAAAWFAKLLTTPQIWPRVRKPGIDSDLESIVMRSIAKDVENRYATMAEFATALDGWIKGKTSQAGAAVQSLMELPFDFSEIAALVSQPPVTAKLPRKPPGSIPPWLMWAGGGAFATVVLGIVLQFTGVLRSSSVTEPERIAIATATQSEAGATTTAPATEALSATPQSLASLSPSVGPNASQGEMSVTTRNNGSGVPNPTDSSSLPVPNAPSQNILIDTMAGELREGEQEGATNRPPSSRNEQPANEALLMSPQGQPSGSSGSLTNNIPSDAPKLAVAPFDAVQAKKHQTEWAQHLGVQVEYTGDQKVILQPSMFAKVKPEVWQRTYNAPDVVLPVENWNELVCVLFKDSLSIFVNDQLIDTVDLTSHAISPATLAFAINSSATDTVVEMDEYTLYDIK